MGVIAGISSSLIERWDLDRTQLAALLSVQRRSGLAVTASAQAGGAAQPRLLAALYYMKFARFTVLGLVGVAGILFPSFFFGLAFSYTLIMLMFGLTLINYLTAVLLDTSDNRILLHLPISGRTLLAARMLCIAEYAGLSALSTSLPTAVALAIRHGAGALLVFWISIFLMLIFLVAVTLALCLFALRHVDPARIRQGILYLQIGLFVLAIYAGSGVLNTDVPLAQMAADVSGQTWWYFYPPGWMAGLLSYVLMEQTRFNGILAATAILAPVVGFVACMLLFSGGRFTTLLSRLEVIPRRGAWESRSTGWIEKVSVLINRDRQQRAVFGLTWKLMRSDQALKLKAYPFIATLLVNIGLVVTKYGHGPIPNVPMVVCFYMPLFLTAMGPFIRYGPEWRAGWCYQVLPFAKLGGIVSGAMTAYLWKHILPIYFVLLTVGAVVWGAAAAMDAVFAGAVATLLCIYLFRSVAPGAPYSRELVPNPTRKGGVLSRFAAIPMAIGLIVTHLVLKEVAGDWGVVGGVIVLAGVIMVALRKLKYLDPENVEAPDHHVGWRQPSS
jgi:hypothetical protein